MRQSILAVLVISFLVSLMISCDNEPGLPIGTFDCKDQGNKLQGDFYGFSAAHMCDEDEYRYCFETKSGDYIRVSVNGSCKIQLKSKKATHKKQTDSTPREAEKLYPEPTKSEKNVNVVEDFGKDFDF